MGAYFQVLFAMGQEMDFLKLGADDELGPKLQDIGLLVKERVPKKKTPTKKILVNAGWLGLPNSLLIGIWPALFCNAVDA